MPYKIISLLPRATEIICALGLEEHLVGRSNECDFPAIVQQLPVCTASHLSSDISSAEITAQTKDRLSEALSIYSIDKNQIKALSPDVIITQDQCGVYAVNLKDIEEDLKNFLQKDCEIVSLSQGSLEDVFANIQLLASKFGVLERGEALSEDLKERTGIIRHKLKFIENKPRVACVQCLSPLMIAGNLTPELIKIAGGQPVLVTTGQHSSYIQSEDLLAQDPDMIIVAACGLPISRTLQEISILMNLPGWMELKAVQNNQVFIADGNHYFYESGPRVVDTIEILAEIINPKQFVFGYEGKAWLKFSLS